MSPCYTNLMAHPEMHTLTVSVDGIRIEYFDLVGRDQDKYLLVLHGWAHSKERWCNVAREISEGFRILIPDLPGFGNSDKPDVSYSLDFLTSILTRFCESIHFPLAQCSFLGHSLGGAISIKLAAAVNAPTKMVLVSTPLHPIWPAKVVHYAGSLAPLMFGLGRMSRSFVRQFSRLTVRDPIFVDSLMIADALKPTNQSAASGLNALSNHNLEATALFFKQ